MPEMLEVEYYRRLARSACGREIQDVRAPDNWYLKGGLSASVVHEALTGASFVADHRIGKLLVLELDRGPTLGLRFGMTGMLEVDGRQALDRLQYASARRNDDWVRFEVQFRDGGTLRMHDPRRLGGVALDPHLDRLGIDALMIKRAQLRDVLARSEAPLKARLMDQARVAGLGNLLTDEILWRAGLDPARAAGSLDDREVRRLHKHLIATLDQLFERGGSHMGDLMAARRPGASCPRCVSPLLRRTIGGRTTFSCGKHQH